VPGPGRRQGAAEGTALLTTAEVVALADAVPARYRAMVLLATFASLRFGEVTALERADLDLEVGTVRVRRAFVEVRGKGLVVGPPKSRAGLRVVSIPPSVVEALRTHLAEHAGPGALVFTVPNGAPVGRGNFNKLVGWREKVEQVGLKGVRFHDLRHTGNTLAAGSGVSTRDLMSRMGHDSMQAALGYQHATATRRTPGSRPPWRRRSTPMTTMPTTRIKIRVTTRATTMTAPPGRSFRPGDCACVARAWPTDRSEPAGRASYRRGRGPVTWAGTRRAGDGNRTRIVSLGS
jgi:integrase